MNRVEIMDFPLDADFSGCKSGWSSRLSSSFMPNSTSNTGGSSWTTSNTGRSSWSTSNTGSSSWTTSPTVDSSSGGSSLITSLLSRTFNSGGHQDVSQGRQVLRGRSQSITPDSVSGFIQIPSFARRGSLFTGNDVGGEGFSSSPLAGGGGNSGDGKQNNDNVEKECKQVFFDCAL